MRRVLALLLPHRGLVAVGLLALIAVDLLQLWPPLLVGRTMEALAAGDGGGAPRAAATIAGLAAAMVGLRFAWRWFLIGASRRVRRALRDRLYAKVLTHEPAWFARRPTGELMALAGNDLDAVAQACGFGVLAACDAVLMITLSVVALALISPELLLIAAAPLPLLAPFVWLNGRSVHRRSSVVQERFARLTERVREAVAGVRVVKTAAREDAFAAAFAHESRAYAAENLRLLRASAAFDPVIAAIAGVSSAIVLWHGGGMVATGRLELGQFVAFLAYLAQLTWPMMAVGWTINLMQRGAASLARVQAVLDHRPAIADAPDAVGWSGASLAAHGLSFRYPEAAAPALIDVSFALPAGGLLAIAGPTGAGKSTLAALLLRVEDPAPGAVHIGGSDVRRLRLAALRRHAHLVAQDPLLFQLSLHDNIALARPAASRADVEAAARLACVHDEILALPQGYDTLVGERGVTLSGGQRQRVAIARAILAAPDLLILDDCLSAVDATTEARILAHLRTVLAGRTAVVIAHRVAALRAADEILVLEHGRVAERGRHDALIAQGGLYARLAELQRAEEALA